MAYTNYKDLKFWQKSMDLVKSVYLLTNNFPKEEVYGLSSQIQRAVVSIPSNISEGYGRENDKEFYHFLRIALGSISEVDTQIELASMLGYCTIKERDSIQSLLLEIRKMICAFRKTLKTEN